MVERVADLSDADRQELRALSLAVYPDTASRWGHEIEWASPEWGVRLRDPGGALVSYVGITLRDAEHDGVPVRVGGIGSVKTHPAARGRGYAARGMARAVEFFHERGVEFGLLVCAPPLINYYARLRWQEFGGRLVVRQRGAPVDFTFNRVMTLPVLAPAPRTGTIDLHGRPW